MKIFRPEHFGGVLYDTDSLRFSLTAEMSPVADVRMRSVPSKRKDILSAPVRAYYELTRACNLVCRHCFVSSSPKGAVGVTTDEHRSIIDQLVNNGVIDVRFTGGEPTQRKDWFDILSYAKDAGLVISLNTNGVYVDVNLITKQLAALNPHQVTISVDGNREHHDHIRGFGSYERTMKSIEALCEAGVKLRINTVITRLNVQDVPEILDMASKYVGEINFFHLRPVGRGIREYEHSLDFDEHFQSAIETLAFRNQYPNLSIMHFEQSYRERSIRKTGSLEDSLSHGHTTINIDCFGGVWPNGYNTYQDARLRLGNLLEDDLGSIWHESHLLDNIRVWFREVLGKCDSCKEYLDRCPGLSPEMEIARFSQGVPNKFCISETPMPDISRYLT
jgi:AdoMet-dependent heme synthase